MGLIKAALSSAKGVLSDQWKEYFYCESLSSDVLVTKGKKKTSGLSLNRKGSSNVITDGSLVAVADGQCMMIVENGKVVDFCAEPGEYKYETGTEPSIFTGDLGSGIKATFEKMGKRFTFGGEAAQDQRVYYFNTKEIMGNKYGTAAPVPFRVIDKNIGLDVDISVRCHGEFSLRIEDPILFYTNVCGNVETDYKRENLTSMLKAELLSALQPAFAELSEAGIRYSALPGHTLELCDSLNNVLSAKWRELRGIVIVSFGVNSVTASKEDEDMIKQLQKSAVMRDPTMAAATLAGAKADAMRAAASNTAGAMTGFMGMGMAGGSDSADMSQLYSMGQAQKTQAAAADSWTCSCGAVNTGKFCAECGSKKPAPAGAWTCSCGAINMGKFCSECGAKKPAEAGSWTCSCGAVNTGKFCAECGSAKPEA